VIVDNLDRCIATQSVELLEQITSLFGFPGVIFVLAAEKERLARAIELRHELPSGEGPIYLEKIVQVEFRVPGLDEDHVLRWMRGSLILPPLELEPDDLRLVAEAANWNPRQIKRLLNNVRIQMCTARHATAADGGVVLASTLILHRDRNAWLALTGSSAMREEVDAALGN
jgi:hypothetical protein